MKFFKICAEVLVPKFDYLISEISELFIDEYVHLGGDGVPLDCLFRTGSLSSNQL